jgi:hypothetical protein
MLEKTRREHPVWTTTVLLRCSAFFLVFGWLLQAAAAQTFDMTGQSSGGGLQIRNLSAYAVYYSRTLPNSGYQPGAASLPSDLGAGGSAQIGWTKSNDRSAFSWNYTSTYTGRVRYSSWNSWSHGMGFNFTRNLAPRWRFSSSVNGDLSTQESFLFASNAFSNVTSVPASFDDLAAALLSSKFSSVQLASAFNSAPAAQSSLRTLLYGTRMFTAGAQASFAYSWSPRLSLTFGGGGGRTQHVSDDRAAQSSYLLPDTTSGSGNFGISYSLSPVTQIGAAVTASRISSSLYDTQTVTSTASLGRTIARRWLVQIHGGVGAAHYLGRQANPRLKAQPQPAFGGSLGYKTLSNTFLGSYDHSVSDSYGLGASTSSSSSAGWRWRRPNADWWLESGLGWEQVQGGGQDLSGWRTSAGLGRALGGNLVLLTQYAYLHYSSAFAGSPGKLSQSAIRVSLAWSPHPELAR